MPEVDPFAPTPKRLTVVLVHEAPPRSVDLEVWNFMDLPCKAAEAVLALEEELRGKPFMQSLDGYRRLVALFAPKLEPDVLDAFVPRQLLAVINATYDPSPDAEAVPGTASPSASAPSITPSPPASAGAPST
jgi:hypothetical protein